jgi:hypothetical protein
VDTYRAGTRREHLARERRPQAGGDRDGTQWGWRGYLPNTHTNKIAAKPGISFTDLPDVLHTSTESYVLLQRDDFEMILAINGG